MCLFIIFLFFFRNPFYLSHVCLESIRIRTGIKWSDSTIGIEGIFPFAVWLLIGLTSSFSLIAIIVKSPMDRFSYKSMEKYKFRREHTIW